MGSTKIITFSYQTKKAEATKISEYWHKVENQTMLSSEGHLLQIASH